VSLWRFISKGWVDFQLHIRYSVGSGSRIRFWHEWWCGDRPLAVAFPVVFLLSRCKEAMVADCFEEREGSVVWNVPFTRAANDWELPEFSAFFALLYRVKIRRGEDDQLSWLGSANGVFSVKSMYHLFARRNSVALPWRGVWRSRCPSRISFFVWEAMHGRILTIDNLRRRGVYMADWCFLCRGDGESVHHVLLHCSMARGLWSHVLSITNFHWVMPEKVVDVLWSWNRRFSNPVAKVIWRMIPSCVWWCLWRERNNRCFEDVSFSLVSVQGFLLFSLFCWANAVLGGFFVDFDDFLSFLACLS
jgi:mannosylglycoprotein endo-beta-mannosidase